MKKKVKREIEVEISVCNICEKEITKEPFSKKRIDIVRGLFSTKDFDVHENCINGITREAFVEYLTK